MIFEHFPVGPIACNCVILGDETTHAAIVVDPGDDVDRIAAVLHRHALSVVAIIATHAHIDHVGGLATLKELTGAPVLLHEADIPLYENIAVQAQWLGVATPPTTAIDRYLGEGSRLEFGPHALHVLHTPGHTPGSVSFILEERVPLVLSGDTLFAGSIGRTDLWGGSFEELMRSIRTKLLTLDDATGVLPGHGPQTTIGQERRTNPFVIQFV